MKPLWFSFAKKKSASEVRGLSTCNKPIAYRAHDFIKEQHFHVTHESGSSSIWGPDAAGDTGSNISQVEGKMDSNNFQQILEAYLICNKVEVEKSILQIINAPKYSIS